VKEWVWLLKDVLIALHDEQLVEHGGLVGIRDSGMLDSALSRPENKMAHEDAELSELAAAYAFGLAKNHPFADGNKRSALISIEVFLLLNGYELMASESDCVITISSLADGHLDEEQLAVWIRENSEPVLP